MVQSRLDYFLISTQIGNQISNCMIRPGFKSDHSLIQITFDILSSQKRGKSYWKFNNNLLFDKTYVSIVKDEIKSARQMCDNMENKNTLWEFIKCQIRTKTISYAKALSKRNKEKENILQKKLESLEESLVDNSSNAEYHATKIEWEYIQIKKAKATIFRSKSKCVESGEKNTKYFLNLEKLNYYAKYIKKLLGQNERVVTKPEDILNEEKQFYEGTLYNQQR